ncbi:MAG: lytic transglycosylase domain-containing protein [Methylocystis sp.]|jgi:soluble lytic murein transglycosylase
MKSLRPFHITTRGAARLGLWLLVGGGVAFYSPTLRERLTKPSAKVDHGLDDAIAATIRNGEWRYAPTPPGETMRGNARGALPDGPSMRENALFAPPDSALLSYEASKPRPDQDDVANAPSLPDPALLLGDDAPAFARALAAYKAGDFAAGELAAAELRAPLPALAARWAGLRLHPREAGFSRLSRFMFDQPNWPARDWLRRHAEEALFGDHNPDSTVKSFFSEEKPSTPAGKIALARVLARDGEFDAAGALARQLWREEDFNETIEGVLRKEFSDFLTVADHKYRADRLLYAEKNAAAMRAAELAGKDVVALARVRAAANSDYGSEKLFATVPASLQNDPGLIYARVHLLRKQQKIAEAAALLRNAPREPERVIDGDAWWVERRLVARKLLDLGDAQGAYAICAQHSAHGVNARVEAEFHAGWIALRFLNDLPGAERHFELLAQIAETPTQKSRAAYWLARTAEARHTPEEDANAHDYYAEAATHSTTFYGQLALAKLGSTASPLRPAPTPAQGDARDDSVRVVELLLASGEKDSAGPLAAEAVKHLTDESQVAALGEVVAQTRDARVSLALGKLASHRGVALDDLAFPAYGVPRFTSLPGSASRSIVYAIARQESAFDPRAISSARAMGLMQMIESTARQTAVHVGVGFDPRRMLDEPAYNAQLGAAHLGLLLGELKGSYLLTFAAYNAGGHRVKEWLDAYGDPRHADVDPVDWIERIPIQETRNYVQRVMENFVVYRAKFGDYLTRAPQMELAHAAVVAKGP